MPPTDNLVLKNARREAWVILSVWLLASGCCCCAYYFFGSIRPGRPLDHQDVRPVLGVPTWFFYGVLVPWALCGVFTVWFAGFVMVDDDLGMDCEPGKPAGEGDRGLDD